MAGFFSKKFLTNYISESISVGFYQYGPALTLGGILSVNKGVILVDHISISMLPPSHSIKKEFNWFTSEPYSALDTQFSFTSSPTKFTLSPGSPYKYNIMFIDANAYVELKSILLNIISAWRVLKESAPASQQTLGLFERFLKMPMIQELDQVLKQSCYWQAGQYRIDICVAEKNNIDITKKAFFLSDEDAERLKENSVNIIAAICSQPLIDYNTVSVKLSDH